MFAAARKKRKRLFFSFCFSSWSREREEWLSEEEAGTNWYSVLEVEPDASEKEIKRSYLEICKRCHPDLNPTVASAEQRFKRVQDAFKVLGNPTKKRQFDELFSSKEKTNIMVAEERPFGTHRGINAMENFFSRKFRWALLGMAPIWLLLYVGISSMSSEDPHRFDTKEQRMVRAWYDEKKGMWIKPSYKNIQRIGPNQPLRKVPESWISED